MQRTPSLLVLLLSLPAAADTALLPVPLELLPDDGLPGIGVRTTAPELEALRELDEVRLAGLPLPDGRVVDLELARVSASSGHTVLAVDGRRTLMSAAELEEGLSLWVGGVAGEPGSDAFFGFSELGSRGWVTSRGERFHLLASPDAAGDWSRSSGRLISDAQLLALGQRPDTTCGAEELEPISRDLPPVVAPSSQGELTGSGGGTAPAVVFEARVALETDYQYFETFGDLDAARVYTLTVMGAVTARYREQLDVVFSLPYLGFYTDEADPWFAQDDPKNNCGTLLGEFREAWYPTMPVEADLGLFLSSASLGCGVAFVNALCYPEYEFAVVGNMHGQTPFPIGVSPLNWDFDATAHELGHLFSSPHTHSFCPPLDECAPEDYWGQCQTQTLCQPGSIMSYCHLCVEEDGQANKTTFFHPDVVDLMRSKAVNSCLKPFAGVRGQTLGFALPGSAGTPRLEVTYDDTPSMTLSLADVPAGEFGYLVGGVDVLYLPIFGGTLVPQIGFLLPFTTTGTTFDYPPIDLSTVDFPFGGLLYFQGWLTDAGNPPEFATATNGLVTEIFTPDPPPPLTWIAHPTNGMEYAALTSPATVWKQQSLAELYGGDLATLTDEALEDWLDANFFVPGTVAGDVYIGFNDRLDEGNFTWWSDDPSTYTNWETDQPNDTGDYAEWDDGAEWNDVNGFDDQAALIERPAGG